MVSRVWLDALKKRLGPGMHRLGRSYGTYRLSCLLSYLVQMGVVKASRSSTTLRGENVIILSMFPSCR